jgi:hypothetical protein
MKYRTEKFEDDNEALLLMAIVRNNTVDLDWLHDEDDAESYAQRCLTRFKAIGDPDASSQLPQTAFLMMRLYRRGDVLVSGSACADDYRDEALRLAKEAALDLYDSVFPDVAEMAREFVEENVERAMRIAADDKLSNLAVQEGEQVSPDQFLPHLLDLAKAGLAETGEAVQQIGWLVNNRIALFPFGMPPLEKYRYFRAVSEVARRINASAIVHISDAYQLTADGERTGTEMVMVTWVNPDGTCSSTAAGYTRRKHPQLRRDIITFSLDAVGTEGMTQKLVPAWGSYRTN